MRKTLSLKDGEAQIGQTVWYVDTSFEDLPELKSIVLSESDFIHEDAYFNEIFDDNSPCFCTKSALLDYCQTNEIECIELERDVYKERLESMEKPKTDIERFKDLFDDFGLKTTDLGVAGERFVSLWDNNYETRFVFDANGAFVNDFNTRYNFETSKTDIERFVSLCEDFGIKVTQTQMKKDRDVIGSFISISDAETETRFVFLKDGKFESFYSLLED